MEGACKVHVSFAQGLSPMLKKIHAEGTLESCRALINQIIVALSAEESLDGSLATELLFYLEHADSALKKSASRPRERAEMKVLAGNYRRR
jgi:hypothetical protein